VPAILTVSAEGVIAMTSLARLKPLGAVVSAVLLVTAGVAVHGRLERAADAAQESTKTAPPSTAAAAPPDLAANRALAREQVVLAEQALDALYRLARNARVELNSPHFDLWEHRRIDAFRKTGAGKAEIVAALEKSIEMLRAEEVLAQSRKAAARGTQVEIYDIQYRIKEAQIWLNEEKAR
jgi:hypothetical protein